MALSQPVQVLDKTVSAQFKHQAPVRSLCPTTDQCVWVSHLFSNELSLLNSRGNEKQSVKLKRRVEDFSVSKTGDIWYCCQEDNDVRKIPTKPSSTKFSFPTPIHPLCLLVTSSDEVIIGFKRGIIKYDTNGQNMCQTTGDNVKTPWQLAECPLTKNIAIVDKDMRVDGGKGRPRVIVLNKNLELLFSFKGKAISARLTSQSKAVYYPEDVCFSNNGDIFIADEYNKSITVISGSGEHICSYEMEDQYITNLTTLTDGSVWAVFERDQFKQLNLTYEKQ